MNVNCYSFFNKVCSIISSVCGASRCFLIPRACGVRRSPVGGGVQIRIGLTGGVVADEGPVARVSKPEPDSKIQLQSVEEVEVERRHDEVLLMLDAG